MGSVRSNRQRLRGKRIKAFRHAIEPLLDGTEDAEVWLFGSLARSGWDACLSLQVGRPW